MLNNIFKYNAEHLSNNNTYILHNNIVIEIHNI